MKVGFCLTVIKSIADFSKKNTVSDKKPLAFSDLYDIIYMFVFRNNITCRHDDGDRRKAHAAEAGIYRKKTMYDKVVEIIARQLQIDTDMIDEHTKIMEDLGADSLDVVEMLMAMEDSFGITVPDEDIEELVTVSDIVEYVESNM